MKKQVLAVHPHSSLRASAKKVEKFDKDLKNKLDMMKEVMEKTDGVGIAANQCFLEENMFIAKIEDEPMCFINAEITEMSKKPMISKEGCLSIPYLTVGMIRADSVTIKYQDENGEHHERTFTNDEGCVIQHEIAHLTGRMILDYIGNMKKDIITRKLKKAKKKHGLK